MITRGLEQYYDDSITEKKEKNECEGGIEVFDEMIYSKRKAIELFSYEDDLKI